MKASVAVASGAIIRSADDWEMSHWASERRGARPQRFSVRIGFRLWGIALDPYGRDAR